MGDYLSYGLNTLGPLGLWQCLDFYYLKDYLNNCNIGIYVASQSIALIAAS